MEDIKDTRPTKYSMTDIAVNSQRLGQHSEDLHVSKLDGVLELRVDTLDIQTTLEGRPHAQK